MGYHMLYSLYSSHSPIDCLHLYRLYSHVLFHVGYMACVSLYYTAPILELSHPSSNKVFYMKYRLHYITVAIGGWTI
jgi:hypothetical protein